MYLYKGHMGTLYFSDRKLEFRELYCEQCGDSDFLLGEVNTWKEAVDAIGIDDIQVDSYDGGFARDYIYEVFSEFDDIPPEEEFYAYLKKLKIEKAFENAYALKYEKNAEYDLDYYNEILTEEFPFIKEEKEEVITEYVKEYLNIRTWLDEIPDGWRKAFGLNLLYDLKEALALDGTSDEFAFLEIKEKYGALRITATGCGEKTNEVIEKYGKLSKYYCVYCGKKAKFITQSWICPWCEECINIIHDSYKPIEEVYPDIVKE